MIPIPFVLLKVLKSAVKAIEALAPDCYLSCNDCNVVFQGMNEEYTALVSMAIRLDELEPCGCDMPILNFTVKLSSLYEILGRACVGDSVSFDPHNTGTSISLVISNNGKQEIHEYTPELANHVGDGPYVMNDTQYEIIVQLSSVQLQTIAREIELFSDTVDIECSRKDILFSCSEHTDEGCLIRKYWRISLKNHTVSNEVQTVVSLAVSSKHLVLLTKATSLSKRVSLYLSNDAPLLVEYRIDYLGYIRYYLAPLVDEP